MKVEPCACERFRGKEVRKMAEKKELPVVGKQGGCGCGCVGTTPKDAKTVKPETDKPKK